MAQTQQFDYASFSAAAAAAATDASSPGSYVPRKRSLGNDSLDPEAPLPAEMEFSRPHSSKRSRSSRWPLAVPENNNNNAVAVVDDDGDEQLPDADEEGFVRDGSQSSGRIARFHEGSMNDKPSEKPPSMFLRTMQNGDATGPSVDQLMEDYMAANETPASNSSGANSSGAGVGDGNDNGSAARVYHRRANSSPRKVSGHRPTLSGSNIIASDSNSTAEHKSSGIYRFGRTIASSFNPVNIWRNVSTNWREASKEVQLEEEEEERARILRERQQRAEEAYAALKQAGQLGIQVTQFRQSQRVAFASPPRHSPVAPEEATDDSAPGSNRDSGISMDDSRSSLEQQQALGIPQIQEPTPRKSSFNFRSPSFSNLKKRRSEAQLHSVKSTPTLVADRGALSPDDQTLRKTQSRKDLVKQQKLTKRVSNLEAKLEQARRELQQALSDQPPIPDLPPSVAAAAAAAGRGRSRSPSLSKRTPMVGSRLPTLPSERLLVSGSSPSSDDFAPSRSGMEVLRHIEPSVKPNQLAEQPRLSNASDDTDNARGRQDSRQTGRTQERSSSRRRVTKKRRPVASGDAGNKPDGRSSVEESRADNDAAQPPQKAQAFAPSANMPPPTTTNASGYNNGKTAAKLTKRHSVPIPSSSLPSSAESTPGPATTSSDMGIFSNPSAWRSHANLHGQAGNSIRAVPPTPTDESRSIATAALRSVSAVTPSSTSRVSSAVGTRNRLSKQRASSTGESTTKSKDRAIYLRPDGDAVPPLPEIPKGIRRVGNMRTAAKGGRKEDFEWPEDVF